MKDNTETEKESLSNGDRSDLMPKDKEDFITCCSWKFVKLQLQLQPFFIPLMARH